MIRPIAIAAFACLVSCEPDSIVKVPSEVTPLLTQSELAQLGFDTKAVRSSVQSEWDRQQFGSATVVEQDVKSLKPMAEETLNFPRYTIIRETYDSPELASNRLKRLRDHDPNIDDKMNAGLVLRDGFATGKDVWIVTTDAAIFSYRELDKLNGRLKSLKNPEVEHDGPE